MLEVGPAILKPLRSLDPLLAQRQPEDAAGEGDVTRGQRVTDAAEGARRHVAELLEPLAEPRQRLAAGVRDVDEIGTECAHGHDDEADGCDKRGHGRLEQHESLHHARHDRGQAADGRTGERQCGPEADQCHACGRDDGSDLRDPHHELAVGLDPG